MRRRKTTRRGTSASRGSTKRIILGIAWFAPEQWERLREVSADVDVLEDTHAEWLRSVERAIPDFEQQGIEVERVPVDVEELVEWCATEQRPVDGAARADFATRELQRRHSGE